MLTDQSVNDPALDNFTPPPPPLSARSGSLLILATKPYAHDSVRRSWWVILSTLALLAAAAVGTLWHYHPVIRTACSLVMGLLVLRNCSLVMMGNEPMCEPRSLELWL